MYAGVLGMLVKDAAFCVEDGLNIMLEKTQQVVNAHKRTASRFVRKSSEGEEAGCTYGRHVLRI